MNNRYRYSRNIQNLEAMMQAWVAHANDIQNQPLVPDTQMTMFPLLSSSFYFSLFPRMAIEVKKRERAKKADAEWDMQRWRVINTWMMKRVVVVAARAALMMMIMTMNETFILIEILAFYPEMALCLRKKKNATATFNIATAEHH